MAIENVKYVDLTPDSSIVFLVYGSEEDWKIRITNGQEVWCSTVSHDDIAKESTVMSQTKENYLDNFKKALMSSPSDDVAPDFLYSMKKGVSAGDYTFTYSKRLEDEGINVLLGKIRLKCVEDQTERQSIIINIMKILHSSKRVILTKNRQLLTEMENERSLCGEAKQVLADFVKEHEENESDLYSNFVHVLNEKKRKLRELKDECESLRSELSALKDSTTAPASDASPEPPKTKGRGKQPVKRKGPAVKKQVKKQYKFESDGSDTEIDEQGPEKGEEAPGISEESSQLSQIIITSARTAAVNRINSETDETDFDEPQADKMADSKPKAEEENTPSKSNVVKDIDDTCTQPNGDTVKSSCDLDDLLADLSDKKQVAAPARRSPAKRSRPDPDAVTQVKRTTRSNNPQSQDTTSAVATRRSGRKTAATCSPTQLMDDLLDGL